jgi:Zn-dependent protease
MFADMTEWIVKIPVLLFAVTIHEYAHGRVALFFGDPTAKNAGRLTWNPISHIDPLGAICLFLFHFGWAKPVPVNPAYFRHIRRETVLMSLGGPLANIAAAFVTGLVIRSAPVSSALFSQMLLYLLLMNTGLGLFNLLPIPPLDGSHVLENVLPRRAAWKYRSLRRYMPMVLMGILLADYFLKIGLFARILGYPIIYLAYAFGGENFLRLLRL